MSWAGGKVTMQIAEDPEKKQKRPVRDVWDLSVTGTKLIHQLIFTVYLWVISPLIT